MQKFHIADHRLIHTDGHHYLFLTDNNAIYEMDSESLGVLVSDGEPNDLTKQAVMDRISGAQSDKEELFASLIQNRVIIPVNGKKPVPPMDHGRVDIPLKTLVFHLTEACNLACRYCYHHQDGELSASVPSEPKPAMDTEVAEEAVDYLFAHSKDLEEVQIVFFGGEPLLNMGTMEHVMTYARRKAEDVSKKITFSITTNGTLLTEKNCRFLNEHSVGVTVSIDGDQTAHDRHRCFPDGGPSYRMILPRIKNLLDMKPSKPVVARVTVAQKVESIPHIVEHLLGLGFSEVGVAPVTTKDPKYMLDKDQMDILLSQFQMLTDKFLEIAFKNGFFGFTNLIDLLVVLHEGEVKNYPCGAGLALFAVDARGKLFICQRFAGDAPMSMGDIRQGLNPDRIQDFRRKAEINNKEICTQCWLRTLCAGGCYHEAQVRTGDLLQPNEHYCQWIKQWTRIGMQAYTRLVSKTPDYLDKLSLLRGHTPLFNQMIQ